MIVDQLLRDRGVSGGSSPNIGLPPIVLMMSNKLGLAAARKTLFSYPTRSEYLKRLADAYNRSRFTQRVADLFAWWLKMTLR